MLRRMYLVYADDSASDRNLQVITAVLIEDKAWWGVETLAGFTIDEYVPEELRADFEFHATDLLHGNKPFENLSTGQGLTIMEGLISNVESMSLKIVYGSVDVKKLSESLYQSANPEIVAFRSCLLCIEDCLRDLSDGTPHPDEQEFGLLIMDDTTNGHLKKQLQSSYREYRKKVLAWGGDRGKLGHLHDDMYFGSSSSSLGIQIADICGLLIQRHLMGKADTEPLYKLIAPYIVHSREEPSIELPC
jgi:hypothetical protein